MNTAHRFLLSTMIAGVAGIAVAAPAAQTVRTESYQGHSAVAGDVIVRFRGDSAEASRANALSVTAADANVSSLRPLGSAGAMLLHSDGRDVDTLVRAYRDRADVMYVEPNYMVRPLDTPNDGLFGQQWGLRNTGQVVPGGTGTPAGTSNVDIKATSAWDITKGSRSFVIGVVDTGVAYDHPDLRDNMWSAPTAFSVSVGGQTINCAAGTHGYNARAKTCDPADNDATGGHGTHVAGTLAASGNNGLGVSGVTPNAQIMALKVFDAAGGTSADIIDALDFAVKAKAFFNASGGANVRILNNSYGLLNGAGNPLPRSQSLFDQMNITANATNNMLFVAAAGNGGADGIGDNNDVTPVYPASHVAGTDNATYVVSVTATDNQDSLAPFSNFGATNVNIGAPGVDILSTAPSATYQFKQGTSQATPMVSGVAALVLAACPSLSNTQLRAVMVHASSLDAIAALNTKTTTGGRLNALKALGAGAATQGCTTSVPNTFTLTATQGFKTVGAGTSNIPSTVTLAGLGGFSGTVAIAATATTGITANLGTGSLTTGSPSTALTINVGAGVAPGVYAITVAGTSGGTTKSTAVSLTVAPTITSGLAVSGALTSADPPADAFPQSYADTYRLVMASGANVAIDLRTTAFASLVEITTSAGSTIDFDDGTIGGGNNARIPTQFLPTGTYFINVLARTTDSQGNPLTGAYTLGVNAPTLDSITITAGNGAQSTNTSVTLAGFGFPPSATITTNDGLGVTGTFVTNPAGNSATGTITVAPNTALGVHNLAVVTSLGTSNTVPFTVTAGVPTLSNIAPSTGVRGTSVPVTLTGTNFITSATSINLPAGITLAAGPTVSSAASMTATFAVAAGATLGANAVTVTTTGGTSSSFNFTVLPPAPTLTNIAPSLGVRGTAVAVTFTGSNFITGATAIDPISGISLVAGPTVTNSTTVTATFSIDPAATLGARGVTVSTTGGSSGAFTFTVLAAPPTLSNIAPSTGSQGSSVPVTLTGTNFITGATSINLPAGITLSAGPTVGSSTSMTATFAVAVGATLGANGVTVSTSGGTSSSFTFTVLPPTPTLTNIAPSSGVQGTSVPVTLTGTNFVTGATSINLPAGITLSAGPTVGSATSMTATFAVAAGATLGANGVTVSTAGGTSGSFSFTVLPPAPTLSNIAPSSGVQGTSVPVTLTGTNFVTGATSINLPAGITLAAGPTVGSATSMTATFAVAAGATLGANGVTVSTAAGTSSSFNFTVLPPTPTLSNIAPSSGVRGASVPVTLTGANFVTGATSINLPAGITLAAGPAVSSATSMTATFAIAAGATLGANGVTVSTAGGTSSSFSFTVLPLAPTLSNIAPSSGVQGTSVPVTLTGTNFVTGATSINLPAGITLAAGPAVASATSMTATFAVAAGATLGANGVTVSTAGGTSSSFNFTVLPPAPALSNIAPSSGVQGTSVPVTLTGTNFITGATSINLPAGITLAAGPTVGSATSMTATFAIAGANLGANGVTVSTVGGTSSSFNFTVLPLAPTLSDISPNKGSQGVSVPVTLTGTNFVTGATSINLPAGITVAAGPTVASGTSMTATLAIAGGATLGANSVTVSTAGGTSGAFTFTVLPPGPTLSTIAPATGVQGTSVPITLTGANFIDGTTSIDPIAGITFTAGPTVVSATSITATFTLAGSATLGARAVTVSNSGGGGISGPVTFTVLPPAPTLTNIAPSIGVQGLNLPVTLTGTNYIIGATSINLPAGITLAAGPSVANTTTMTATFAIAANATLGNNGVTVSTAGGTTSSFTFTVLPPAPTLSNIAPSSGVQGTSVPVTLTGTNFINGATSINFSTTGIILTAGPAVTSATSMTATFAVAAGATLGANGVTVSTAGGTSSAFTFTVLPPAPTLANIAPATGVRGTSVPVTLTGTNFITGATSINLPAGITLAAGPTVGSGISMTATFAIAAGATLGANGVTVSTAGGTSSSFNFTVLPPAPTLSNIAPSSGNQGTSVPVTLTGTNFITGATSINLPTGITLAAGPTVGSGTSMTATFAIAAGATLGANGVTVSTTGGTSSAFTFTVIPPVPTLSNIAPSTGVQGTNFAVTLTGTNFIIGGGGSGTGATFINVPAGITATVVAVTQGTSLTANFAIAAGATLGANAVTVSTSGGTSNTFNFTVLPPAPTLSNVSPSTGVQGTNVPVTLTGTNFISGATSINLPAGITLATGPTVGSGTSMTATLAIAAGATLGANGVSVSTAGGTTSAFTFTVFPPLPTLSNIAPSTGVQGTSVPVTLTGANFVTGATSINLPSGITLAAGPAVGSGTSMTATFAIAAGATLGANGITVSTAGGTTSAFTFTVLPPLPTLSNISPSTGVRGTNVPVTLTGTNFITGATTINLPAGITLAAGPAVGSGTSMTATFAIAVGATLGANGVTVSTAGGTSSSFNFTVLPPAPTLSDISPNRGNQGVSVPVTLTGTNFITGATTINLPAGMTLAAGPAVSSGTSMTATFAIAAGATLGANGITVSTAGGTTSAFSFTVVPPVPTLSNIAPSTGVQGASVAVTLTGSNFISGATTINLPAGITLAAGPAVTSTTSMNATFAIAAGATLGVNGITVSTAGGTTGSFSFTVQPPLPTLSNIAPPSGVQGTSVPVTLTGTSFVTGATSINLPVGITLAAGPAVSSAISMTATFAIAAGATLGPNGVTVSTAGGTSSGFTFTVLPPQPTLSSIGPTFGILGAAVPVTLTGTNFISGATTIDPIAGVTIGGTNVVSGTLLTATFTIGAGATVGARNVTVTTAGGTSAAAAFSVVAPFADLTISSSHTGNFGVGFTEPYTLVVSNLGTGASSGPTTVTDVLPAGLTFSSGTGTGWSCLAGGQTVTCTSSTAIAVNGSSTLTLNVTVGAAAAPGVTHSVSVTNAADLITTNNSATDATTVVAAPTATFAFNPSSLIAGEQATLAVALSSLFPHDVTGSVTLSFNSSAAIPLDDPAIQFATGGRLVAFTIAANTLAARFGSNIAAGPVGFQTGTVAGTLAFAGVLQVGTIQTTFSPSVGVGSLVIPASPPSIQSVQTTSVPQPSSNGQPVNLVTVQIRLSSTMREVTEMSLQFNTTPSVRLSCGTVSGCTVSGNTLTFNVKALFDAWFGQDVTFGSLTNLRLPLSIAGTVHGSIAITLRNSQGASNSMSFDLP